MNALRSALLADARIVDALYWLCFLALPAAAILVLMRGRRARGIADAAPGYFFAATAISLLAWLGTLYAFYRYRQIGLEGDPAAVLLLGRANFAAVVPAVYFALRFVFSLTDLAGVSETEPAAVPFRLRQLLSVLSWESVVMTALTVFTPLVDRIEAVSLNGESLARPATTYGALFPFYVLHVCVYLAATVWIAFRVRRHAARPVRDQLGLVALGTLTTGSIALVTNAALPYFFDDFRFTDVGTLSTIFFLLAVGWAVARHRLFDLKLFIRRTLVYGILLSVVVSVYSAVVLLVTQKLAERSGGTLTQFTVLVLASTFDPLRRFLEGKVDGMIFRRTERAGERGRRRG